MQVPPRSRRAAAAGSAEQVPEQGELSIHHILLQPMSTHCRLHAEEGQPDCMRNSSTQHASMQALAGVRCKCCMEGSIVFARI